MLSPRSPRSQPGVPGDSLTHLHPRAPEQPRPGTELSSPQTHTAHSQRGVPLRGRRSGAGTRPGLPTTPRPEPSSLCFSMRAQSCPTLCDPMDCSSPGSSVRGISQARTLEWVAISYSRGSSRPREQTLLSCISCIGRQILYRKHPLGSPPT